MKDDTKYNGWTNYATWRVNLEIFDGMYLGDVAVLDRDDVYQVADNLKEYAEESIHLCSSDNGSLAVDYALAFLDSVNWREIAQHMIDDYFDEQGE